MLEKLLKELGERHFEVSWRYEVMTNSIIVRMEKRIDGLWRKLDTRVDFSKLYSGGSTLREMANKMERDFSNSSSHSGYKTKVTIADEMKGENTNAEN